MDGAIERNCMNAGGIGEHRGFGFPRPPEIDIGVAEKNQRRHAECGGHVRGSAVVADKKRGVREQGFHMFEIRALNTAECAERRHVVLGRADKNRVETRVRGESKEVIGWPGFVESGGKRMDDDGLPRDRLSFRIREEPCRRDLLQRYTQPDHRRSDVLGGMRFAIDLQRWLRF